MSEDYYAFMIHPRIEADLVSISARERWYGFKRRARYEHRYGSPARTFGVFGDYMDSYISMWEGIRFMEVSLK